MKLKHIICAICLLTAGIVPASAIAGGNTRAESAEDVRESSTVQLLSGAKSDDGRRISMKCGIARRGSDFVLKARILEGAYALSVAGQGIRLTLDGGETLTLVPMRGSACCSDWAAGRWNNVAFSLSGHDVGLLRQHGIVSLVIPAGDGADIRRDIAPSRQHAVGKLIRSVE